jgi:hypothetical protein
MWHHRLPKPKHDIQVKLDIDVELATAAAANCNDDTPLEWFGVSEVPSYELGRSP